MWLLVSMACDTIEGRLRELHARLVARRTLNACVTSGERHVRESMIESGLIELDDPGVSALVLRMARLAFGLAGLRRPAVKASRIANIPIDVFVAIQATG